MGTWNPADRQSALDRAAKGEKLSDFELRKLREATHQSGHWGTASKQAITEDEKRFGKR